MMKQMSLQARLSLFLAGMFGLTFVAALIAMLAFSGEQLEDEHAHAVRLVRQFSELINQVVATQEVSQQAASQGDLARLLENLPQLESGRLSYVPAGQVFDETKFSASVAGVPDWFEQLIGTHTKIEKFSVTIGGRYVGEIVFVPDLSADYFEKWVAFLVIAGGGAIFTIIGSLVAFWTVRRALAPVRELTTGLIYLDRGDYGVRIACEGPPEIERSCLALNDLAATLQTLSADNARLLRRSVEIHDEERSDLARELHDELGPQLFAIRASALSLGSGEIPPHAESGLGKVLEAVENLQKSNRRILDRLRPMHIQELGLIKSVEGLVLDARSQSPQLQLVTHLDPGLAGVDPMIAQTIYRVFQEALTNVLKHAQARNVRISGAVERGVVCIEVSDDGRGFGGDHVPGRGLTGMRERIRALGGTFSFERRDGRTIVSALIPDKATQA